MKFNYKNKISSIARENYPLAVIFIPLLALLGLLYKLAVNLPFADHFALVPLFMKLDEGTFGFSDLWAQHNEHRILFPRAVALIMGRATNWYTPAELLFSVIVATIGLIFLALMLRKGFRSKASLAAVLLIVSAWFYSPIQWQNWLWGWQIEWFMSVTSVIIAVYLIDRYSASKNIKLLIGAILAATIATYSLGSGMYVWIVGFAMLAVFYRFELVPKKAMLIWAGAAAVEIAAYYINYRKPLDSPSPTLALDHPGNFINFFVTTLGRPVTGTSDAAYLFGLIVLSALTAITIYTAVKVKSQVFLLLVKWYALIGYAMIALLATSAARLGLGPVGAVASRYTAFSLLIIIGIIAILSVLINASRSSVSSKQLAIIFIVIFTAPLILNSYTVGIKEMKLQSKLFRDIQLCTSIDYPTDHCLRATFPPSADAAREWIIYLKQKNYAGY